MLTPSMVPKSILTLSITTEPVPLAAMVILPLEAASMCMAPASEPSPVFKVRSPDP